MFRIRIYVLLKSLMLAKTAITILTKNDITPNNLQENCLPMCPDLNLTQDIPASENNNHILLNLQPDQNYSSSVTIRNEVDEIQLVNMPIIPESIGTTLKSIESIPNEPRAFVEFNGFLNKKDISVTFRWNQPEFTKEMIQGYTVQCWFIENLKEIQVCDKKSILTTTECTEHNLKPNTTYYFKVQAHTKAGAGPYTDLMNVSTTHENPIPQLLIEEYYEYNKRIIRIFDLDSKIYVNLLNYTSSIISSMFSESVYSVAEYKIYWITITFERFQKQLMTWDMNTNNITKMIDLNFTAHNLCIDWIGRNLYWIEYEQTSDYFAHIIKLDLTMLQNGIVKYDKILSRKNNFRLTILPSMGFLYWIEKIDEYEIMKSDLDGKNVQFVLKNNMNSCPDKIWLGRARHRTAIFDITNNEESLIYWIVGHQLIVANIKLNKCNIISIAETGTQFKNLKIDKINIYASTIYDPNTQATDIYILKRKYALLDSEKNALKHVQIIKSTYNFSYMIPFGNSLQPYPRTECLIPYEKNYTIVKITVNSIVLNLPEPTPKRGCTNNLPITKYTIFISYCLNNSFNKSDEFNIQTYERHYEIQNLTPFTEYKLKLALSNFYSDQLSMDQQFSSEIIMRTNEGKLNAPENVTVQVLTPNIAVVYWMPPTKLNCATVTYKIYWESNSTTNSTQPIKEPFIDKVDNKFFTKIQSLQPEQKYSVYVRVYPGNYSNIYTDSMSETVYMYSEPNNITLSGVSINSMNISWIPSVNLTIHYTLEYKNDVMQKWQIADNFETNNETVMYYIENLFPATLYKFRLILIYPEYENFTWPSDENFFTFQTLGDVSSPPLADFLISLITLVMFVVLFLCCIFNYFRLRKLLLCSLCEQCKVMCKKDNEQLMRRSNKEVPVENFVFNTAYSSTSQYNPNVLTKIKLEQVTLTKLLGSGAFGMVYQGNVKNVEEPHLKTPVAIKTLGKRASPEEKKKFLEEARIMKYFRHENVLRLLAVCLDEDSPLLVLELMETDLLKYLRECRIFEPSDLRALRLQDLLAMCEDVARGCCYLEMMRFVHRDLACRNCLMSARDRENPIVKIGDFGLARDIYRNDYYRKEGEGLLPIRWMASESLVNGIFTSQTDVWSFGVLMWEITSLGEQPYSTIPDREIIKYVCNGGRLQMPLNCPFSLYQLMQHCWSAAIDRPNFEFCLNNITTLRSDIKDVKLRPMKII